MNAVLRDPFSVLTGPSGVKAALRPHLARALVASSTAWVLAFAALGLVLARLPAEPDVFVIPDPPPFDLRRYVEVEPLPSDDVPPMATVRKDAGVFEPVADDLAPPAEALPSDVPFDPGGEAGVAPGPPSAREAGVAPVEVEVLPGPDEITVRDKDPVPISQVKPSYPEIAVAAGIEGRVTLKILVDRNGAVVGARVLRSSPMFDEAALEAARQWRFLPAMFNGRPIAVWIAVPVHFTLR